MLDVKLIRVLDRATDMVVVATNMQSDCTYNPTMTFRERSLLGRAGYGSEFACILLTRAQGGKCSYDAYSWGDRTMGAVHKFLENNWKSIKSGRTLDVCVILGEKNP